MSNPTTILSAHPVADSIRAEITGQLAKIEHQYQVSILFACESGSRGWGFASPDSDYDVRFIYVHQLPWYLQITAQRDVIELPINQELDISGWELRKTLGLLYAANPTLFEWLDSPIIYHQAQPWVQHLRTLTAQYFSPLRAYHHYVSMAKKNLRSHLSGDMVRHKKYFYVLRPLLAARWIRERGSAPPMRFAELVQHTLGERASDNGIVAEINALLEIKMRAGEAATSPRRKGLDAFIKGELILAQNYQPPEINKNRTAPLDDFLRDAILHHAQHQSDLSLPQRASQHTAVLAGGCFWGVQGVFQHVKGISRVIAGYAGGAAETAQYAKVTSGTTGHAEAVHITYDPDDISYQEILQIYFSVVHDPTQLNRQGPDHGSQYRSAIFPQDDTQENIARATIAEFNAKGMYPTKIVTTIETGAAFYRAEEDHQNYMARHPAQPYIAFHDRPKVAALKRLFPERFQGLS